MLAQPDQSKWMGRYVSNYVAITYHLQGCESTLNAVQILQSSKCKHMDGYF